MHCVSAISYYESLEVYNNMYHYGNDAGMQTIAYISNNNYDRVHACACEVMNTYVDYAWPLGVHHSVCIYLCKHYIYNVY